MNINIDGYLSELGEYVRGVVQRFSHEEADEAGRTRSGTRVQVVGAALTRTPLGILGAASMGQPEFSSEILDTVGADLLHLGQIVQAEPLIEAAFAARFVAFGEDHPITAKSYNTRARLKRLKGDVVGAEKDVRRALAINSRVYGEDSYAVSGNLTELAIIQLQAGEFAGAERAAERGLQILEQLYLEETDPNTTRLLDVLARVLQTHGAYDEAIDIYQRILRQDERQPGGERHLKYATHVANFALVLLSQRRYAEAESLYLRAIDIYEKAAPQHPSLIDIRSGYAAALGEQKKPGVIEQYQKLIAQGEQVRGANHPYVGNEHACLARALYNQEQPGFLAAAVAEFDRALAVYEASVKAARIPEDHVFIAESKAWKARVLVEQAIESPPQDHRAFGERAESLATVALRKFQTEFAEDSVELAITRAVIARALTLQGKDKARALALLTAAQPIVVTARGADSKIARLIAAWIDDLNKGSGGKAR